MRRNMLSIKSNGKEYEILNRDCFIDNCDKILEFKNIKQIRIVDTNIKISFKIPLTSTQLYDFIAYADNAWLI